MDNRYIIVFDGVCNFCNGAVNFIIRRDPEMKFAFTPMQSDLAGELTKQHGIHNVGVDTFLLIKNGQFYIWTDAVIEITKDLSGRWYLCAGFKILPRIFRDWIYRIFARNRYRLFGRKDYCMVPSPELMKRFVGV